MQELLNGRYEQSMSLPYPIKEIKGPLMQIIFLPQSSD